jgi:hypothetical protein
MRWTGAEIAYLIAHWHDEDTSNAQLAAGMAEACGCPRRTAKAIEWYGSRRLQLGSRPRQIAWWRGRESELRRYLLTEGLSLRQVGELLGRTRNSIASAKHTLGWCSPQPKHESPSAPRTRWAERPFPGVVL